MGSRTPWKNRHPLEGPGQWLLVVLIQWVVINTVDSFAWPLNNWAQNDNGRTECLFVYLVKKSSLVEVMSTECTVPIEWQFGVIWRPQKVSRVLSPMLEQTMTSYLLAPIVRIIVFHSVYHIRTCSARHCRLQVAINACYDVRIIRSKPLMRSILIYIYSCTAVTGIVNTEWSSGLHNSRD